MPTPVSPSKILTVSQLNRAAQVALEDQLGEVWVTGEVSNCIQATSGHYYFSLKDENAQVRCALFRGAAQKLHFKLKNGLHINVKAQATLYSVRGDYQLIVKWAEEAGVGALQQAFEALKKKLLAEGLFDSEHKQAIPAHPQCIGVITSPTGAAVRDVLKVIKKRFSSVPVIIYPTLVQGEKAPPQIVDAIETAVQHKQCDCLLLVRGGGSLEDLWAFNDERVARAIFKATLPIISGVGHEVDVTIADFVADYRAPTPSAAAEAATPDQQHTRHHLEKLYKQLQYLIATELKRTQQQLTWLNQRLRAPELILQQLLQRYDDAVERLSAAMVDHLQHTHQHIQQLILMLQQYHPKTVLSQTQTKLYYLLPRLHRAMQPRLAASKQQLNQLLRTLDALSPLGTLARGYAIVRRPDDQRIIRSTAEVKVGETIESLLADGTLQAQVTQK